MATGINHPFVSAKSDGGDATLVRPSNWNADHDINIALIEGQAAGTAPIRISGMSGHPDITVAGANDKEFDSSTLGGTAVGSLTAEDADTTRKGHYYAKKAATATFGLHGRYWTTPSTPFTMTAKLCGSTMGAQFHRCGLIIAESTTLKTAGIYVELNSAPNRAVSTITTSTPTTGAAYRNEGTTAPYLHHVTPMYLRIVAASSTDVTYYFSTNGETWTRHNAAGHNPGFTIANWGLVLDPENSTVDLEASWDWVRFT